MDSECSEKELIERLQGGDKEAFTELYDRFSGVLYWFVAKRMDDRSEAKDLVHDFFLKLWERRTTIQVETNLTAYLFTSIRHAMLNKISREKVRSRYLDSFVSYLDDVETKGADFLLRENELQATINKEIEALHPRMRQVFELSRKSNLSRKEIALALGISEETVKNQMHKALKILKGKLGVFFIFIF